MSENPKRLIGAREVAEKLHIGRTKAYELIHELNLEMERKGCRTIPGRVSCELLDELYIKAEGRLEVSVKLAKNGTWLAQFRCKDKFGNEVHKCKRGFATAEEAQAWEDEFITSTGCTMEMTFGEFFKVYEADLRPRLREHTWRQKEYAIKSRVLPFFANKKMDKIRTIDIVRWQNTLMASTQTTASPTAPRTCARSTTS